MTRERDFLEWIEGVQDKIDKSDDARGQAVVYEVKMKFIEVFKDQLKGGSIYQIIQKCLEAESLSLSDLKNRSKYLTDSKHRAIRSIHRSLPYPVSAASLADMLKVNATLVQAALSNHKSTKRKRLFKW